MSKVKVQKRVLLFFFLLIPAFTICQNTKGWQPLDKAALIAYLANPGSNLGTNSPRKGLFYSFYINQELFDNNSKLKEKTANVFYLTYRYALKNKLRLYDTLYMTSFTLDGRSSKSNISCLERNPGNLRLNTLQKFSEVAKILIYPCVTIDGYYGDDRALIYKLDTSNCPATKKPINRDTYTLGLGYITKDYVVSDTHEYKGVVIAFTGQNDERYLTVYYRFDDKKVFGDMYRNGYYRVKK